MDTRGRTRGGGRDRGQTNMDFAIGIGLFLLAIAFVLTFVPSIITPFDTGIGGAENAQADRIGEHIITEYTEANDLKDEHGDWDDALDHLEDTENRTNELGLRYSEGTAFDRVNIAVVDYVDGEAVANVGDEYEEGQTAASSSRIVTSSNAGECEPACRITVRVW